MVPSFLQKQHILNLAAINYRILLLKHQQIQSQWNSSLCIRVAQHSNSQLHTSGLTQKPVNNIK